MKQLLATTALSLALVGPAFATDTAKKDETALEQTGDAIKQTASDAAEAVENTADDAVAATKKAADATAEKTENAIDAAGDATREANQELTNDATPGMVTPPAAVPLEGYALVEPTEVTAEELDGARVYDSKNEWIGEISEIVLNNDGEIETLVVDVGGFLGIGEKPVGLGFESFSLQKEQETGELRTMVSSSKEELEQLPEYDS
ncbi:PRC-barrel domain-containing protein [Sedimentitalea todarodis]|uniref:PRC-barrel domain-containing protein n=1 Tax=Sedimentitalea todarodis TaxID=1631240 RepID=A0ABU3VAM3_9RHOB|nr:PRC-barrel domain-containing protein [Sedimentitalea todarodis]MDU9002819.1 PRC-barrel domain-containing protein [Sedimentitalea todarodis]